MPLVSRPFSINTYCFYKVWLGSVDLRVGDIKAITSKVKSYVYYDFFQKPSEVLLCRGVKDGGLGLHHLESKAKAHPNCSWKKIPDILISSKFET